MQIPSEQEIIAFCANSAPEHVISLVGKRVLRMTDQLAVKYGSSVTIEEANNQRFAYSVLDPQIIGVPQVHCFFTHDDTGYLVMDFVAGKTIPASALEEKHYQKIAEVLSHFHTISRSSPGNLTGDGISYYCPFPDEGIACNSLEQMETWFNSRLFKHQGYSITFRGSQLVLCHRDFFDRNMLWKEDGSLYLLDWLTAGFYPTSFEVCTQRRGDNDHFREKIEQILFSVSSIDLEQVDAIQQAWWNCQRYAFKKPDLLVYLGNSGGVQDPIAVPENFEECARALRLEAEKRAAFDQFSV